MQNFESGPRADTPAPKNYDSDRLALTKSDFRNIDTNANDSLSYLELIEASKSGFFTGSKLTAIKSLSERIKNGEILSNPNGGIKSFSDVVMDLSPEIFNWYSPDTCRKELTKKEFASIDANNDGRISPEEIANAKNMSPMKQHAAKVLSEYNYLQTSDPPIKPDSNILDISPKELAAKIRQEEFEEYRRIHPLSKDVGNMLLNSSIAGATGVVLKSDIASAMFRSEKVAGRILAATEARGATAMVKGTAKTFANGFSTTLAAGTVLAGERMWRDRLLGPDAKSWESTSLTIPMAMVLGRCYAQKAGLTGCALTFAHALDSTITPPSWLPVDSLKTFNTLDAVSIGLAAGIPTRSRLVKGAVLSAGWFGSNVFKSLSD